jgi:hypothetical protein
MAALEAAIQGRTLEGLPSCPWMAGSSPAMTGVEWLVAAGHTYVSSPPQYVIPASWRSHASHGRREPKHAARDAFPGKYFIGAFRIYGIGPDRGQGVAKS